MYLEPCIVHRPAGSESAQGSIGEGSLATLEMTGLC